LKKVLKQAGVVHDIKSQHKSIKTVVPLLCMPYTKKEMHGRDTTVFNDDFKIVLNIIILALIPSEPVTLIDLL